MVNKDLLRSIYYDGALFMYAGLNSVYYRYMLHYTKTCKQSTQHKCQISGQFSKKSDKNIYLIYDLQMEKEKSAVFINILQE